jgi:hypothetical protein
MKRCARCGEWKDMEEIAKCEVVCANCHMRREQKRRAGGVPRFWPKLPSDEG